MKAGNLFKGGLAGETGRTLERGSSYTVIQAQNRLKAAYKDLWSGVTFKEVHPRGGGPPSHRSDMTAGETMSRGAETS